MKFTLSTSQYSSTGTPLAHNNVSLVHTLYYTVPVTCKFTYVTSGPPSPSNGQPLPPRFTTIGNSTTNNNPPKPVPHVTIEPDSDPRVQYYSLSDSSDSYDSGYYKRGQHMSKKRQSKRLSNNPIKFFSKLTSNIHKAVYK